VKFWKVSTYLRKVSQDNSSAAWSLRTKRIWSWWWMMRKRGAPRIAAWGQTLFKWHSKIFKTSEWCFYYLKVFMCLLIENDVYFVNSFYLINHNSPSSSKNESMSSISRSFSGFFGLLPLSLSAFLKLDDLPPERILLRLLPVLEEVGRGSSPPSGW